MVGTALVLASATAFATSAILIKIGYQAGLTLDQVLALRFALATPLLATAMLAVRQNFARLGRRRMLVLFLLGAVGYAGSSYTFYAALQTLPVSLVALVTFTYPALVALGGWVVLKQRISLRHGIALAASFLGVSAVIGAHFQWGTGIALALVCPVIYSAYVLISDRVMRGIQALPAAAIVVFGAAVTWTAIWAGRGGMRLPGTFTAWTILIAIVLLPTVLGILLFLAALPKTGGARAALLSTWEPVVTVCLAAAILGDRLSPIQIFGGALVIGSMFLVHWPVRKFLGWLS